MKKIIVFIVSLLLLVSCSKKYEYVEEVIEKSALNGTTKRDKKPEIIRADSDTMAYINAFTSFCISLKVTQQLIDDGMGEHVSVPVGFKLYNEKGIDISNITFAYKDKMEKDIYSSVFKTNTEEDTDNLNSTPQVDSTKINELLQYFNVTKDEFDPNGLTWYKPKSAPKYTNRNGIYLYYSTSKDGINPLRFRVQYYAEDWLFFKKIQFSIDSSAYEYVPRNTETDNGAGYIWEWFDEALNTSDKELINALANAKSAKMKFIGRQYYDIINISKEQITDIKRTIELYKAMGGSF
jgi:hypothetical protein